VHKQTLCCLIITPDFTPKSQTYLLHVRGFTPVNKKSDYLEVGHILHGDHFVMGDLLLALLRTYEKQLTLGLIHATAIC
jgi:hypothetical protein